MGGFPSLDMVVHDQDNAAGVTRSGKWRKDAVEPTDIAIIGLACRFPAAASPGDFWRLIRDGRESAGSAIDGGADFDAQFFGIAPREAGAMDPRQRLALELAWELLEDAFIVPEDLRGQQVSVYLGAMNDDYAFLTLHNDTEGLDSHSFAGSSRGMIANRISYAFGMHGPSMTVDSGQSSSLVAVHLAYESLQTNASPVAIAGGIHLNLTDETIGLEREFGAMSASGHTFAFDERADGYVRSQGGALVLLKPLRAALDDNNRVRAVIRGSAVGNAGHSAAGLTVPSVFGEAEVIRRALADAGLDRAQVDYVEAHGTGTAIGDPIEIRALEELFGERRDRPVMIGSVKTNIGHTGAAAGIAGLLKAVLAIENSTIPASLNYDSNSSVIELESLGLRVSTALTPWPATGQPRRAGVSSFGMGGTNAHVILEQAPPRAESIAAEGDSELGELPWVLSAQTADALTNQANRLLAWVGARSELDETDIAWSLATTRSMFEHRAVVVGADRAALLTGLGGLVSGEPASGVVAGHARPPGKTTFVFPGQGSQWVGMGQELYRRFPLFAAAFDEVNRALDGHLRIPLRQVMWGVDEALLESTEFAQPALFAVEVALAALLEHWGVVPELVMGHSVGEVAAAYVAGVLTLSDAAALVAARGRLMAALPAGGMVVAVAAAEQQVVPLLADGVSIAAVNAPDAVVISGPGSAVGAVMEQLVRQGRRVRRLAVSHAFHSALMEPMLGEFAAAVAGMSVSAPQIDLVSNVTGELAGAGYGSASYWVDHVRMPVRFADSVRLADSLGASVFVEVGPNAGLTASPALLDNDGREVESLLTAVARLFTAGVGVDWAAIFAGVRTNRVELPTYGFARQRFWLDGAGPATGGQVDTEVGLWDRLAGLDPDGRHRELVELVRAHAAVVLGHSGGRDIDAERAFQDLGFGSMTGVELCNRLKTATGLPLPRTLIFDYPTAAELARYLGQRLFRSRREESDDERIWSLLRNIPVQELRRTGLLDKLMLLAGQTETSLSRTTFGDDLIDSLSPDALIAMALNRDDGQDNADEN
ncbi:MAG: hypothetical protein QOG19_569 [Mycobacterium sp.]|nr:hypothetical protein [Mycobacterium sp.]